MTKYQKRVLNAMPEGWISTVGLTDIIYPTRFRQNVQGLRLSQVRDAITVLKREGFVISNKKGLWKPFDYEGKTSFNQEPKP